MKYLSKTKNASGAYPAPQSTPVQGYIPLTDEQAATVVQYNGFVIINAQNSAVTVEPNFEAWEAWKAEEASKPEPEPEPSPEEATLQAVVRLARMQAQALPDAQALEVPELYEGWAPDTAYSVQHIVSRPDGHLYRCQQAHTSQEGWEPENTPALWVVIANTEAGTLEDPITAARGMEYQYGLYYRDPEDGKVYLCERIGEAEGGKIVLQYLPHELVGQYFTAA